MLAGSPLSGSRGSRWRHVEWRADAGLQTQHLERASHTATAVDANIYVIAGRKGSRFLADLLCFDTVTSTWHVIHAQIPNFAPRGNHTAVRVGQQIWVIGGGDGERVFGDVAVLDLSTMTWSNPDLKGNTALLSRTAHAADVHPSNQRAIIVFGGYAGTSPATYSFANDLVIIYTDSGVVEQQQLCGGLVPAPRGYHSLTSFAGRAYLIGGRTEAGLLEQGEMVSVYDPARRTWARPLGILGKAPVGRSSHRALALSDRVVIHGGARTDQQATRLGDLLTLHACPTTGQLAWSEDDDAPAGCSRPCGRSAHTLTLVGSGLYVISGYVGAHKYSSDIHVLELGHPGPRPWAGRTGPPSSPSRPTMPALAVNTSGTDACIGAPVVAAGRRGAPGRGPATHGAGGIRSAPPQQPENTATSPGEDPIDLTSDQLEAGQKTPKGQRRHAAGGGRRGSRTAAPEPEPAPTAGQWLGGKRSRSATLSGMAGGQQASNPIEAAHVAKRQATEAAVAAAGTLPGAAPHLAGAASCPPAVGTVGGAPGGYASLQQPASFAAAGPGPGSAPRSPQHLAATDPSAVAGAQAQAHTAAAGVAMAQQSLAGISVAYAQSSLQLQQLQQQQQLQEDAARAATYRVELSALQQELGAVKSKHAATEAEAASLRHQLTQTQAHLRATNEEQQAAKAQCEAELSTYRQAKLELQEQLAAERRAKDDAQTRVQQLQQQERAHAAAIRDKDAAAQRQHDELQALRAEQRRERAELDRQVSEQRVELERLSLALADARAQFNAANEQLARQSRQAMEARDAAKDFEKEATELRAKLAISEERHQNQLAEAKRNSEVLSTQLSATTTRNATLEGELRRTRDDLEHAKASHSALVTRCAEQEAQLAKSREEAASLRKTLDSGRQGGATVTSAAQAVMTHMHTLMAAVQAQQSNLGAT